MATSKKRTLNIKEEIQIDRIAPTPSKAYDISLIDSVEYGRVLSIRKQYKKKTSVEWKPGKAMWIPFEDAEQISRIIKKACEEGKRRHWDAKPAQTQTGQLSLFSQDDPGEEIRQQTTAKHKAPPSTTTTAAPPIDVEKELHAVKEKLEQLEHHIHNMSANTEQKEHLELIERILKALS